MMRPVSGGSLARGRPAHNHGGVESELICLAHPRRGHFELGTGYHGDLWLDLDALFLRPAALRPHVQRLGDRLAELEIDAVCGPMTGGAFLALTMAELLGAAFLPAYSCPAPSGGLPGYGLHGSTRAMIGGWRVAIVDDAVNAATAAQACFRHVRDQGAVPVAVAALLALGPANDIIAATMAVPFYSVATMPSQVWPAADCPFCACGTPLAVG